MIAPDLAACDCACCSVSADGQENSTQQTAWHLREYRVRICPHRHGRQQETGSGGLPWPPGTKSATKSLGSTSLVLTELFSLSIASPEINHIIALA